MVVATLLTPRPALAQAADPRSDFLDALGRFSLALDGTYGDEGRLLSTSVDAMAQALSRWDAFIESRERAMAAEIGTADRQLASRMHLALGGLFLDRGRVSDALKEFAAARSIDSTRPEAPLLEGLAHSQITGDAKAATDALKAAHALAPNDAGRTYLLAQQLLKVNQEEAGLELLQRIQHGAAPNATLFIRLDLVRETPGLEPFFPPALYTEGFASIRRGELSQATAQLREASRRDPLNAPGEPESLARATAAFRAGEVDEARSQLESAIEQLPNSAEVHRVLGMVELADGDTASGISRLRAAVRLNPNDERARLSVASSLVESEQLDEAEHALLDALKALPTSGRAHYLLALTYQRQGRRAEALRELQAALLLHPLLGVNTIYRMMGTLQQDEQDLDGAAKSFAARVDLVPNAAEAHRELGKVYFRQGDDVRARAEFEVTLLLDASDVEAYTSLGQIHLRGGRLQEAADLSRQALEIDPGHREARYVHATSLLRMGNTGEGTAEMQVFQRLQAEDGEARTRAFELGRLRREASVALAGGDSANAVLLFRRVLVYEPRSATSHLDLGLALLEAGQATEAVERLTTAAALNAPIEVHRHLARAYGALGQAEESRKEQLLYERLRRESISKTGRAR
jgi:tetratricopeptide (TPR) repeat protein